MQSHESIHRGFPPKRTDEHGLRSYGVHTIHGDADPTVPYNHAVLLHQRLDEAGVLNELMTIPGGQHGRFRREQNEAILAKIHEFLRVQHIIR